MPIYLAIDYLVIPGGFGALFYVHSGFQERRSHILCFTFYGLTPFCRFVLPADDSCQYLSTPSEIVCYPAAVGSYRFVLVYSESVKKTRLGRVPRLEFLTRYHSVCSAALMGTSTHQRWAWKAHIGGIIPQRYTKLPTSTVAYTVKCGHPPKCITCCHRGEFINRFLFESPFFVK